jgi:hypothetical protein
MLPALQGLVYIGFEDYRQQKRLPYSATGLGRKADKACYSVMGILNRFYRTLHFSAICFLFVVGAYIDYFYDFVGSALARFELSTLPDHEGTRTIVLRFLKIITPVKVSFPFTMAMYIAQRKESFTGELE